MWSSTDNHSAIRRPIMGTYHFPTESYSNGDHRANGNSPPSTCRIPESRPVRTSSAPEPLHVSEPPSLSPSLLTHEKITVQSVNGLHGNGHLQPNGDPLRTIFQAAEACQEYMNVILDTSPGLYQCAGAERVQELQQELKYRMGELSHLQVCHESLQRNHDEQTKKMRGAESRIEDLVAESMSQAKKLESMKQQVTEAEGVSATLTRDKSKLIVQLKGEKKNRKNAEGARDECEKQLRERMALGVLGRGVNVQGKCPTLPEIMARIRRTLNTTVCEWIEKQEETLLPSLGGVRAILIALPSLFRRCRDVVEKRYEEINLMFLGGQEESSEGGMDPATADFMRQHLCRHRLTLFPLSGRGLDGTVAKMIEDVAQHTAGQVGLLGDEYEPFRERLVGSGVGGIIADYLDILSSSKLLCPTVKFSPDCGLIQAFCTDAHSPPIDGDRVKKYCMVIFPALMEDKEGGSCKMATKRFVLAHPGP